MSTPAVRLRGGTIRPERYGRPAPTSVPPLTTHRFKFGEIETAFKMMQTKGDGMIKPLITFS